MREVQRVRRDRLPALTTVLLDALLQRPPSAVHLIACRMRRIVHRLDIVVEFIRPGHRVRAEVQRADGAAVANHELYGTSGVLTDLHKGKSSGGAWSVVIDAVCVLLGVICATGLVLWSSLKSRAKYGAVVVLLGGAVAVGVYWWFVP